MRQKIMYQSGRALEFVREQLSRGGGVQFAEPPARIAPPRLLDAVLEQQETWTQADNRSTNSLEGKGCHPTYQLHPTCSFAKKRRLQHRHFGDLTTTSLDLGGRNKGLGVGRRQKWLTGADDMGGRQCEMGIGQLDSAPGANRSGFWAPTTDKKSLRSQAVCHSRSTSPADLSIHSFGLQSVLDRRMLVFTLLPVYLISGPRNAFIGAYPLEAQSFQPTRPHSGEPDAGDPTRPSGTQRHSRWRPLERPEYRYSISTEDSVEKLASSEAATQGANDVLDMIVRGRQTTCCDAAELSLCRSEAASTPYKWHACATASIGTRITSASDVCTQSNKAIPKQPAGAKEYGANHDPESIAALTPGSGPSPSTAMLILFSQSGAYITLAHRQDLDVLPRKGPEQISSSIK
ncbi:uncharacterized protein Triagg1_9610 [Trichoderma aggressivum f. europaeum]|uniref:Uncharacterized protein n=1 Tax=Trichoderma aggressivum f. europaeum TaxID=173218 RepID=A0AAE1I6B3_9HYPO|nr:hypothetical protein Triagg1_9610 [Trichoderma aggressivum f. europaeum]